MDSPWLGILFNPAKSCSTVIADDEAPVLVVIPVIAGISMILASIGAFHTPMTVLTQVGFALLVGPPAILVASWWLRLCLGGVAKLLGVRVVTGALVCIIAWSWLPLLYLSLVALALSCINTNEELLMSFQAIALVWQLVIIGAALRKILSFTLKRIVLLMLSALLLYLLTLAACGYGLGTLVNDWFKLSSMV